MGHVVTKGVFELQEILELQKKIVPELVNTLEKRYNVLRTIFHNQPIGRRVLADMLNVGERTVRTEIGFLKEQGLIEINTSGMTVTSEGVEIIHKLNDFIHEIKGLSEVEKKIQSSLNLKKVIIVPGDVEENPLVLKDLGKACANYVKDVLKDNSIIALTGGSTLKEVVEAFPRVTNLSQIQVVPARGGMGKKVETQANTLAATLAKKLNGTYKMLHISENLSLDIIGTLLKEEAVKVVIDTIHKADVLIYGIGNAVQMARKRGVPQQEIDNLINNGAVGEAFGCYFNKDSKIISETTAIGIKINEARKIKTHIAVAGGKNKVESIIATEYNDNDGVLVTDEAAAKGILSKLNS
ncbi:MULTISPECIES: sugar-binding transcriptional regulator [Clostridium]|jgi:central glycolytic genes regulator|uniref:Central glycolytic protein regulator n=2 Tax=Clostridium beijerinckii TaxID=1520 RepID=A0A1S8SPG0_CLOBE|nr:MULTISPECIES: sugar-binding domain-containing protein [Clostridium]ALB48068.2 sugar-binding transcriptional regulator [Clostridium beijerinckii NRRL B-598]MBA2886670.1 central glycolytic genes regulator [Clostridium beijerinckii]MBA2911230.1 central glycolytic genes regulator [Clostridium beijerinckii]MBC2415228.1 sugar-binding transcriptional regulator [Clostridium beijerinckii]MBC2420809.1 sugar-binding transcriptional regulator [Clostridium beijerinckii]